MVQIKIWSLIFRCHLKRAQIKRQKEFCLICRQFPKKSILNYWLISQINSKICLIQSAIGYNLPNDRYEDDEDSISSLIASQAVEIGINQSFDITKAPYFGFDPDARTLFAKCVPKSISRFDIYEIARQLKGFKNITVS